MASLFVQDIDTYLSRLRSREPIFKQTGLILMRVFQNNENNSNLIVFAEWVSKKDYLEYFARTDTKEGISSLNIEYEYDLNEYELKFHRIIVAGPHIDNYYVMSRFQIPNSIAYVNNFKTNYTNQDLKEMGVKEIEIYQSKESQDKITIMGNWLSETHYKNWLNSGLRERDQDDFSTLTTPQHSLLALKYQLD